MAYDLIPRTFFTIPRIFEEMEDFFPRGEQGGLTVSEDDKNVYVEAALPGVDPKDVEVTYEKGVLWIRGEAKEEEKGKKYYRKAERAFSYRVTVPADVDSKAEPMATHKNGITKVAFAKAVRAKAKKIAVKAG